MDSTADDDPFNEILDLETQYHKEGYDLGVTDGSRAGRIEGRIFGLENGFDKFLDLGRLNGRAAVWDAGLRLNATQSATSESAASTSSTARNDRLAKHVTRLRDLTDLETLSTENSEDAVSEFDDRLKDAKAKATLIAKMLGEESVPSSSSVETDKPKANDKAKQTSEIEDFTGTARGKAIMK